MPLYAQQFFTDHLTLPFETTVLGNTCYAIPEPANLQRLRIDFAPTIRHNEYDGLRLQVIHPGRGGAIDTALLPFAEHGTFTRRDAARGICPGQDGYARIRDWHPRSEQPPWQGADVSGLRRSVEQYAHLWFPPPNPTTAPPLTARQAAAVYANGTRTRSR